MDIAQVCYCVMALSKTAIILRQGQAKSGLRLWYLRSAPEAKGKTLA